MPSVEKRAVDYVRLSGNGEKPSDDGYEQIVGKIIETEEKFRPISFGQYLREVWIHLKGAQWAREKLRTGNFTEDERLDLEVEASYTPRPHPGDIMYRAVNAYGSHEDASGRTNYSFFTERGPQNTVFGNEYAKERMVGFMLTKTARISGNGKALLILGATGSGKSRVVNVLESGYEEHTLTREPVYAIAGCPFQDNPLLLLPQEVREDFKAKFSLTIEGEICPHCQEAIEELKIEKQRKGEKFDLMSDIQVQRVRFSAERGEGIVKIEPRMTKSFDDPKAQEAVIENILRARGGILEIEELSQHRQNPAFLKFLMNLIRERKVTFKGRKYPSDFIILTHATLEDMKVFKEKAREFGIDDFEAFMERFTVVNIPYLLSRKEEAKLYRSTMEESGLDPHISPQTLEMVASIALASRLEPSSFPGVTIDVKLDIYDGMDTEVFTQRRDRKTIEDEGRGKDESLKGIPPTKMIELLGLVLEAEPKCVTPSRAFAAIENFIKMQPTTSPRKSEILKTIENLKIKYNEWLFRTVMRSFRGDVEESCQRAFTLYLEEAELFVTRQTRFDPRKKEWVEPDERFMRQVEEKISVSEFDKKGFRETVLRDTGSLAKKEGASAVHYERFPKIKAALEKVVTGESEEDTERILVSILSQPDEKQQERIDQAIAVMSEKYGFCDHCAPELLKIAARNRQSAKNK